MLNLTTLTSKVASQIEEVVVAEAEVAGIPVFSAKCALKLVIQLLIAGTGTTNSFSLLPTVAVPTMQLPSMLLR